MLTAEYYVGYQTECPNLLDIIIENIKKESVKEFAKGEVLISHEVAVLLN